MTEQEIIKNSIEAANKGEDFTYTYDGVEQKIKSEDILDFLSEIYQSDWGKSRVDDIIKQENYAKKQGVISEILKSASSIGEVLQSQDQLNRAKQLASTIKAPRVPDVDRIDPALNQEIAEVQRGTLDPSQYAGAARAGIEDTYRRDLGSARSASTGQAGAYGAMSQLASSRRNRANIDLAPQLNRIRAGERNRLRNLLNDRRVSQNAIRQQQMQNFNALENRYNLDSQAAGQAMAAARYNRARGINNVAQYANLPSNLSSLFQGRGVQSTASMPTSGGGDISSVALDYEKQINRNLGLQEEIDYNDPFSEFGGNDFFRQPRPQVPRDLPEIPEEEIDYNDPFSEFGGNEFFQ